MLLQGAGVEGKWVQRAVGFVHLLKVIWKESSANQCLSNLPCGNASSLLHSAQFAVRFQPGCSTSVTITDGFLFYIYF